MGLMDGRERWKMDTILRGVWDLMGMLGGERREERSNWVEWDCESGEDIVIGVWLSEAVDLGKIINNILLLNK